MNRLLVALAIITAGTSCAPTEKISTARNQSSSKNKSKQDEVISDNKNSADAKSNKSSQKDASTVEESDETISEKNSASVEPTESEAHQDTEGKGFANYDIQLGQNLHIHFTEKEGILTCKSCPPGTKIDQEALLMSWTPTSDVQGITVFELDSNVGAVHSDLKFSVTVTDPAKAPVFDTVENMTATKLKYLSFTIQAKDPQGSSLPILYSCDSCPTNMTIDQNSGFVEWTPTKDQLGAANVTLRASTIYYQVSKKTLTITVNDSDDPPEFTPIAPIQVNELDPVTFELKATDPNGSPVTYRCKDGCTNGAVLTGATVSWTPTISQSGNYVMTFAASDGKNESTLDVQIAVIDRPMRGAFAISIGDSVAAWKFGFGKDETTFDKASAEAIAECKSGACVVENTYTNSCAAFAANSTRAEKNYSVSWGSGYASRKLAEENVLANCNVKAKSANGAACVIIGWSCSGVGAANEVP